jgi:DNA-binding GntR family transcriptional regulator
MKSKAGSRETIRSALEELIRSGRLNQEQRGRTVMVTEADSIQNDGLDS